MSFSYLRTVALTIALAALPASAGTILILATSDPNGADFADTTGSSTDASWSGLGAGVNGNDLSIFGSFSCLNANGCSDVFTVDFAGEGFAPGTMAYVAVSGSGTLGYSLFLSAVGESDQSLGFIGLGGNFTSITASSASNGTNPGPGRNGSIPVLPLDQVISAFSTPILVNQAGNFTGSLQLDLASGSFNLPSGRTADLILNSVPEPGTLAIGAACILLLVYVKRLRKA